MPTATFFGATGGCALAALVKTLEAGIATTALVRTPSKLRTLLSERGLSNSTIDNNLRIVEGNAKDPAAVKNALQASPNVLSDIVIFGIGGTPTFHASLTKPIQMSDPNVCAGAMSTVVGALRELRAAGAQGRPLVATISTTGVSPHVRDVPLMLYPLYHWALAVPHKDKRAMEVVLETAAAEGENAPFAGFVVVRPTLLTDGAGVGLEKTRFGWEGGKAAGHGPALGYTIARNDVGAWIFEKIVKNEQRQEWAGRMVTLA